jgi:hypothetical protein
MWVQAVTDAKRAIGRPARALVLTLTLVLLTIMPGTAHAGLSGFVPSSRKGAGEVWVEFPRFTEPFGDDYVGDYALTNGWGFGLGVSFGLADKLCLEGRSLQTNHTIEDAEWDLDLAYVGLKYCMVRDSPFQPFLSAGYVRQNLETDLSCVEENEYVRLTGHGILASAGMDYFRNNKFFITLRVEYAFVDYSYGVFGTEEQDLAESFDGRVLSASIGLGYRAPIW